MIWNRRTVSVMGCILFAAILAEVFIGNFDVFMYETLEHPNLEVRYEHIEPQPDESLLATRDHSKLIYQIPEQSDGSPSFVGWLELDTDPDTANSNIQTNILVDGQRVSTQWLRASESNRLRIHKPASEITLELPEAPAESFSITQTTAVHTFELNPVRLLYYLLLLSLLVGGYFYYKNPKAVQLHTLFLILAITIGGSMSLLTPVFYSWDEGDHFIKAYNVSYGNIIMRTGEEIPYPDNMDEFLSGKFWGIPRYGSFQSFLVQTAEDFKYSWDTTQERFISSTALTHTPIPYLVSGIGIAISRMLGIPLIVAYFIGRFFNLILYTTIGYMTIRSALFYRPLIFMCFLLPTFLFQAASYAADSLLNATAMMGCAFVVRYTVRNEILTRQKMLGLLTLFSVVTLSKVTYAPLFLMLLAPGAACFDKSSSKGTYRVTVVVTMCMMFVAAYGYALSAGLESWPRPGADSEAQKVFIMDSPLNYLYILMNAVSGHILEWFRMATTSLAYIGDMNHLSFMIVLCSLFYVGHSSERYQSALSARVKWLFSFSIISALALSLTALYVTFTTVGHYDVEGFQGRYVAPFILPACMLLRQKVPTDSALKELHIQRVAVFCSMSWLLFAFSKTFAAFYQ